MPVFAVCEPTPNAELFALGTAIGGGYLAAVLAAFWRSAHRGRQALAFAVAAVVGAGLFALAAPEEDDVQVLLSALGVLGGAVIGLAVGGAAGAGRFLITGLLGSLLAPALLLAWLFVAWGAGATCFD